MNGLQRIVRRALLMRLADTPELVALVGSQIHPQAPLREPTWPFVKTGSPSTVYRRATCLDGAIVTLPIHAFAKGREVGGSLVETAEDHAGRIGAQIEAALNGFGVTVEVDGATARLSCRLIDAQLLVDGGEPGAFHWFANVRTRVTAA